jgi:hypothetical protein
MAKKKNTEITHVHITPAGLETLCKEIWGDSWRSKFSEVTGLTYSQLHRYMTVYKGQMIPQIVVVALEAIRMLWKYEEVIPNISNYRKPISEATPVKFVQEKKVRPPRPDTDAPLVDFFSETKAAPTPEPAPEPDKPKPKPKAKPAKAPAAAPAKAKTAPKRPDLKQAKAGPETGPAKRTGSAKPAKAAPKAAAKPVKTPAKKKATA